jgi:tetrapyrrole methylase family protein/MazG family protein
MPQAPEKLNYFESLVQVIKDLRGPDGCPWDREQTHLTLTPYALEETCEMIEALESQNDDHICEELGDVLFQVVLHAQLAEERKSFSIQDVIEGINSKIVRRHPHVFSNTSVADSAEVLKNWEQIKKSEKRNKPEKNLLFDIPPAVPALQTSHKIGEKTKKYKFDWNETQEVLAQLKSEITELEEAMSSESPPQLERLQHELGDVLFSASQLGRHLNLEPETCLRNANRRFISRFMRMVQDAGTIERFTELSQSDKEKLWTRAKQDEHA